MQVVNPEFNKKIRAICEKSPCSCGTILKFKKEFAYLREYIENYAADFNDLPFTAKIWFALTERTEYAKCECCGNDLPHDRKCRPLTGYDSRYCSRSCSQKSEEHRARLKKNCRERYGTDHPSQCPEIRERISESHLRRSADDVAESNEKRAATNLKLYGVKAPAQMPEIARKCGEIQKNRSAEDKTFTELKRKRTKKEKYGDENYSNPDKARRTLADRAKADPNFLKKLNDKISKTVREKYGVAYALQTEKCRMNGRIYRTAKKYDDIIAFNDLVEPMFDKQFYIENYDKPLQWRCKKCGNAFTSKINEHQPFLARCEKCFPINAPASDTEKDILKFISEKYAGEIVANSRSVISPKELDIYLPEKRLAIEFDGLYWHSENTGVHQTYHLEKTEMCENANIRLIHIFENEWMFKREIVKSRILNILGVYETAVFARKCEITEIDRNRAETFLNENHIQGNCVAKTNIGLVFNGELVSLMTFGKCRFDKKHEWEMLRFCCKLGYHIPGAASKMLTYFERNYRPKSLVSYADRRWSEGDLYKALGFTLDHISKPDYWYWKHSSDIKILESRIKYQKHKLNTLLKKFDSGKSEKQNMFDNGFYRIFDCGNYVFEKIYI